MKTSLIKFAAAVGLGCAIATPAFADNHQFRIIPAVGYNFYDNDRSVSNSNLDDSDFFGIGFGTGLSANWSIEGWITRGDTDDALGRDVDIDTYRIDALYDLPHLFAWTPYIVGGVGRATFEGQLNTDQETQLNLGFGLKRSFGDSWGIRGDIRAFDNIDQGSDSNDFGTDFAFQLALTYGFGKVLPIQRQRRLLQRQHQLLKKQLILMVMVY